MFFFASTDNEARYSTPETGQKSPKVAVIIIIAPKHSEFILELRISSNSLDFFSCKM
jgi:hypothetical protein